MSLLERAATSVVELLPKQQEFYDLRTNYGTLVVGVDSIVAMASGSRVFLDIGNPLSADLIDLVGTFTWGAQDRSPTPPGTRQVTIRTHIRSGAWTPVSFEIDSVPPSALGNLRIADVYHLGIVLVREPH